MDHCIVSDVSEWHSMHVGVTIRGDATTLTSEDSVDSPE